MAASQETLDLRRRARRRLIGAIALVLALVLVPPWLMDLEPKPVATNLTVEIPAQDSGKVKPPLLPKPDTSDGSESKPSASGAGPAAPARTAETPKSVDGRTVAALGGPQPKAPPSAPDAPAQGSDGPRREPEPPKAAEGRPKLAEAAGSSKAAEPSRAAAILNDQEAYVVPLGTFGNLENVKQLQARLAKAGVKTFTEPVKTASGEQTRVRAGPYGSRDAAEKAREKLTGMGIEAGNVTTRQ